MIKAVIFDIDDTLYNFKEANRRGMEAIAEYLHKEKGVSREQLMWAIGQAQEVMGDRLGYNSAAFHNRQIRYQNALEILGIPIYPYATQMYKIYWNTVIDLAEPEPGLCQFLADLKKKGVHLGIGSDMTSYIQNAKLEKMQIGQYFDAVVTSEEAGEDKPGLKIFELCIQKARCLPEECLFIGDNVKKDYQGAKAAGMQAVCYARYSGGLTDKSQNVYSYEELSPMVMAQL